LPYVDIHKGIEEQVKLALTEFTHNITIAVVIGGDVSYDFMSEGSFRPPN
jgi:hypothetical protein